MPVLIEGISVIIKRESIDRNFLGGWEAFFESIPNETMCTDEELVRVGFMTPKDVEHFVRQLESNNLFFKKNGEAADIAVVDQITGPTIPTNWLKFLQINLRPNQNPVLASWLYDSKKTSDYNEFKETETMLSVPVGWTYEKSLYNNSVFVPDKEMDQKVKFLRHENGLDVYLDLITGEELFLGRT